MNEAIIIASMISILCISFLLGLWSDKIFKKKATQHDKGVKKKKKKPYQKGKEAIKRLRKRNS